MRRKIICFEIVDSKVCNFNFSHLHTKNLSIHNGQHHCPFIFGKNGRYSKQIPDCFELGNMGLFVEQKDHK